MASQSEGIQRLLEAEAEAKKQLDHARRRKFYFLTLISLLYISITFILEKAIKLKQAKEEAKIEIGKFTKEREAQFKVCTFQKTCKYSRPNKKSNKN